MDKNFQIANVHERNPEHENRIVEQYKTTLLENLAKEYRIKLDDPEGKEKYYEPENLKKNKPTVALDTSIQRSDAFLMFFKRKHYLNDLLKKE